MYPTRPNTHLELSLVETETLTKPAVTVVLPHQLRERAGGSRSISVPADTVRGVIEALDRTYSGMGFNLCFETGELRPFVNVFVGPENVKYLEGLDTRVGPGDVVHIIHSVAGGAGRTEAG